jgi:hypothetical protein
MGLKPTTSDLEGRHSIIELQSQTGADNRIRTDSPLLGKQVR